MALREKALPGESDNQTAQRLMREALGVSTMSTEPRQLSTVSLDERIESIVEERLASFAANQNDLFTRLQERIQQLEIGLEAMFPDTPSEPQAKDKPVVDTVDTPVDSSDRLLTQGELAKRLGVHTGTLSKNRTKPNFGDWSKAKDPEQLAWRYLSEVERYAPLSTGVDAVDMEGDLVGDAWKSRVDEVVGGLSYAQ